MNRAYGIARSIGERTESSLFSVALPAQSVSRDRTTRVDDSRSIPLSLGIISFVRDFNPFVALLVHTVEFLKLYEESGLRNWKSRSEGKNQRRYEVWNTFS